MTQVQEGSQAQGNRSWLLNGNGTLATLTRVQMCREEVGRSLIPDWPSIPTPSLIPPVIPRDFFDYGHVVKSVLSREPVLQFPRTHCSFKENSAQTWAILHSNPTTHCCTFPPNWTPWTWWQHIIGNQSHSSLAPIMNLQAVGTAHVGIFNN